MRDRGVGQCPKRPGGLGHIWKSWKDDPRKSCMFCGRPGRDNWKLNEIGGFFAEATDARFVTVKGLPAPMVSGSGDPKKAWPDGMPAAMAEKAAEIVADKKRRDAEAVANGTARPGQVAGAPKGKS